MILYIPTRESEALLELLEKNGSEFNEAWLYDMKEQIREQLSAIKPRTVSLEDAIKKYQHV